MNIRNVTKNFGGLSAVSNLTFDLDKHEILGLIGPNGAGKTTVFNLLTGVLKLSSGSVFLDNENIANMSPHLITQRGIARTFQNLRLLKGMTVLENMRPAFHLKANYSYIESLFCLARFRQVEREIEERIYEILEVLQIAKYANATVDDLAYGVLKKVELARALTFQPKILFLGEPAAGLNPIETDEIMDIIMKIHGDTDMAILVVEHNMKFVMGLSQRVIVMNQGSLIAQGTPEVIQNDERVIKAYLGEKAWRKQLDGMEGGR